MNRPKLILLVGIPGSGKTTYAKNYIEQNSDTIHLSSDAIRKELYGDEAIQGNPGDVFALMQKRAVEALNEGYDVIYDATNIARKDRASIISVCPKFAKIEVHIIWAPIETCIERDAARERTVGKEVIDKMLKRFQPPFYDEGFNDIKIILPDWFIGNEYENKCMEDMKIPHDNPHHTANIFDHCISAALHTIDKRLTMDVKVAALYHDIGKPYVKAFIDSKGNECDTAHYYQHQCVGAWMAYGLEVSPFVVWLIGVHMDTFLNTKYYNKLPPFLKKQVDLLHEADLAGH
jgi:putative nucleotidyltransferase with HDIG domain